MPNYKLSMTNECVYCFNDFLKVNHSLVIRHWKLEIAPEVLYG